MISTAPVYALILAVSLTGQAEARKAAKQPVAEPEMKRVRTIRVDPCEVAATFAEVWKCRGL